MYHLPYVTEPAILCLEAVSGIVARYAIYSQLEI
jgi:hypothetical protein